jgi:hypothetical protein
MPGSIGFVAGEDEAGRTPPSTEQAPQAQTQAQTATATHEPLTGQPGERPAAPSAQAPSPVAGQPAGPAAQATTPAASAAQPPTDAQPEPVAEQEPSGPGFGERGRMRRRARFLRKARELAYRDLGGLVYDLHRFGQRNDPVVLAKLATLGHIDAELRALEQALHEIRPVTVLREVGIAACPRCASIHGNEDRFCPGCGLAFSAGADRPLSTAPVTVTPPGDAGAQPSAAPASPAPGAPASTAPGTPTRPAPGAFASPAPGAPASPAAATPAQSSLAPGRPAGEPLTTIQRPPTAAPVLKPAASPVAARPPASEDTTEGAGRERNADSGNGDGKRDPEDEPTQVLRPPAGGV